MPAQPRSAARSRGAVAAADDCKAGLCGGMARYPVAPGIRFYSTFNVPGLPLNQSAIENDVTFFIVRRSRARVRASSLRTALLPHRSYSDLRLAM